MLAAMRASASSLTKKARATIAGHDMLRAGQRVLVAVSGGADSVALAYVLAELGYPIEIAHFDHETRDGASAADARFVERLANRLNAPYHLERRPVAREACAAGKSFEHHARDLRYAFFLRTARERGIAAIATGHHADDQAETVLLRILRGSGLQGLAGIPPVRETDGARIVRPLIACSRVEILAYLRARRLRYRTDVTNAHRSFPRNRIRHELIPMLERAYNPAVRAALLRLAEMQRRQNAYLRPFEEKALKRSLDPTGALLRAPFRELPEMLRHRCIAQWTRARGVACDYERILAAADFIVHGATGRRLDLGAGTLLYNGREAAYLLGETIPETVAPVALVFPPDLSRDTRAKRDKKGQSRHTACPCAETRALGRRFLVRRLERPPRAALKSYCTPTRQVFDADALGEELIVRTRRAGDRFTPLGMSGAKKLSDFFIDRGVPAPCRDIVPLVADGARILWVVGYMPSALAAVGRRTRRLIEIEALPDFGAIPDEID